MVPCFFLNPNWWDAMSLLSSIMGVSRWSSIFSRILDRSGRRLIGRYDVVMWSFSRFCDHYDLSYLPLTGKVFDSQYVVIYLCYRTQAFLGKFLKDFSCDQIVAWGLYGMDFTLDDIFFIARVIWCGTFSSFVMVSSSISDSWDGNGWKTDARCFAKAVAFCLSVRAQVLWLVRSGGIWCWCCFILRVAFHNEYSAASVGVSSWR